MAFWAICECPALEADKVVFMKIKEILNHMKQCNAKKIILQSIILEYFYALSCLLATERLDDKKTIKNDMFLLASATLDTSLYATCTFSFMYSLILLSIIPIFINLP